jgi:cathepsin L
MGCNGGDEDLAMDYARDNGMMSEASYPYVAVDQECAYDKTKVTPVKPTGHTLVKPNNAIAVKTAIAAGPVSVAIEAD